MSLAIAQQAWPEGKGHWGWRVQLTGPVEELDRVEWVEYRLHPTFSPPVHRVDDRASGFRLEASGWGEFMIHAAVRHRDGSTTSLQHWLELDASTPPGAVPASGSAPEPTGPVAAPAPRGTAVFGLESPKSAEGAPRPTIYLSSGLADREWAHRIREAMTGAGVAVRSAEDLGASAESVEEMIRRQMEVVDGAVFLVSRRVSPWLRRELGMVREMGLPRAVISLDSAAEVPGDLAGATARELAGADGLAASLPAGDATLELERLAQWAKSLPVQ